MKRLVNYTREELAKLGGKVGPSKPGEMIGAGRHPMPERVPLLVERTNHLPKRRRLFAAQRTPEA